MFVIMMCPLLFIKCMCTCFFMALSFYDNFLIFFTLCLQKKYRQDVSALKFTSVEDTPEMVQAKLSNKLAIDVS